MPYPMNSQDVPPGPVVPDTASPAASSSSQKKKMLGGALGLAALAGGGYLAYKNKDAFMQGFHDGYYGYNKGGAAPNKGDAAPQSGTNTSQTPNGGGSVPPTAPVTGAVAPAQQPQEQIASKSENDQNLNPAQVAAADARNLAASEREMNAAPGGGTVPNPTSEGKPMGDDWHSRHKAGSNVVRDHATGVVEDRSAPGGGNVPNPTQVSSKSEVSGANLNSNSAQQTNSGSGVDLSGVHPALRGGMQDYTKDWGSKFELKMPSPVGSTSAPGGGNVPPTPAQPTPEPTPVVPPGTPDASVDNGVYYT